MKIQWKRFLTLFLVLALAMVAFTACGGEEEDPGIGGEDTVLEEEPLQEDGVFEEEPLEEEPLVEEPLVEEEGIFGTADLDDDLLLDENEFNTFLTDNDFVGDPALAFDQYEVNEDAFIDEDEFNTFVTESEFDEATGFGLTGDEFLEDEALVEEEPLMEEEGVFGTADLDDDLLLAENEFNTFLTDNDFVGDPALAYDQYDVNEDAFIDEDEFNTFLTESEFDEATGFGLTGDEFLEDEALVDDEDILDESAAEQLADIPGFMTADTYQGLTLVSPLGDQLGVVVDGFFDMNGDIQYMAIDLEDEAWVEIETLLGDEELFDEEVDTILISQNLINAQATADLFETEFGAFQDEVNADVLLETPAQLLLLEGVAAEGLPWVAQEIDAAALAEGESFFVDTTAFGLEDQFGPTELLQVSIFEVWEGTDNAIETAAGDELGDIDELIIDFVNGEVAYVTVDTGGWLGLDGVNNAVLPWETLQYQTENNDFVVNVDQELLEQAPTLADDVLEAGFFGPDSLVDVDPYWGID